jgi:hypothetical protein
MAKKIEIVGAKPKKIDIIDKAKRRINAAELATALGANPAVQQTAGDLDLIALAELGTQLLSRLRSSGGRPALADATEICRVPLSAGDLKALEKITEHIAQTTGSKPSPGQVASIVVREYLATRSETSEDVTKATPAKAACPEGWNGNREKYRSAQQLIQDAKSTWGGEEAA